MGNQTNKSLPQEAQIKTKGENLNTFITLCPTPSRLSQALKVLIMLADTTQLDEADTQTILVWQEFLEENKL